MTRLRKSGQSYLINLEGTIAFNTPLADDHQAIFDEFLSEEQILLDIETAFDADGLIQITTNPHYAQQYNALDTYDEYSIFDHGAVSKTFNAVYLPNRPYFFPVFASIDDYMWKCTRKVHKRLKQGQLMAVDARYEDQELAIASTVGSAHFEYIAKMDLACIKGRH